MAKEILDLYIEQGYEYPLNLDFNASDGSDLETDYTCFFESPSIGTKQFSVISNAFSLTLSEADTSKLTTNLEEYVVYAYNITNGTYDKLLSGRIHVDSRIRG